MRCMSGRVVIIIVIILFATHLIYHDNYCLYFLVYCLYHLLVNSITVVKIITLIAITIPAGTGDAGVSFPFPFFCVGLASLPPLPFFLCVATAAFFRAVSSAANAFLSASSWASRAAVSAASYRQQQRNIHGSCCTSCSRSMSCRKNVAGTIIYKKTGRSFNRYSQFLV